MSNNATRAQRSPESNRPRMATAIPIRHATDRPVDRHPSLVPTGTAKTSPWPGSPAGTTTTTSTEQQHDERTIAMNHATPHRQSLLCQPPETGRASNRGA